MSVKSHFNDDNQVIGNALVFVRRKNWVCYDTIGRFKNTFRVKNL